MQKASIKLETVSKSPKKFRKNPDKTYRSLEGSYTSRNWSNRILNKPGKVFTTGES